MIFLSVTTSSQEVTELFGSDLWWQVAQVLFRAFPGLRLELYAHSGWRVTNL
jgi:hypothetical protein